MADIRVNALPDLPSGIAAEDILHILDASTTDDVDSQTTVDAVADWIIANKSVRITGIDDVPGLRAALDSKADIVHTHTVAQVIGLQADLDAKTDVTQAQIIGRNIVLNGKSINVPSSIAGLQDDRIPDTVVVGEYLQFGTTGGGINNITGDTLKGNLALNLVNNTADTSKPVSGPQQDALDLKVDTTTYTTGQSLQDINILSNGLQINTNTTAISLNTDKISFDTESSNKLATIETGADVTDTTNVWSSLGISDTGSTGRVLSQRGVFVDNSVEVTKSDVDRAIGAGTEGTDYYSSNKTWLPIPTGGGTGTVTKAVIDAAIGASPTGNSGQFYNEQGNFIDVNYDTVENAPIIRNATVETITISGTRTNVQVPASGQSEMSTITMLDSFNPVPTQYTTTFTSPNTTFTPALVFPAGSQGRQLSLTELDGTVHRFCYLVNGNYRLLDGGLSGTVRLGPVAVATTATVTAAVTVPDQTAGQTITLTGDETGTFSVGDFISPQANNFGAYRGIFVDSITFDGTNTVIVGPSNGATTFNTTSVLRNAGPADTIQGTFSNYSYDPDTTDTVYSNAVVNNPWSTAGADIETHITRVANSIVALDSGITWDGIITSTTLGGEPASSVTINLGTESNIDSSFTITGGINNMETVVNTDGAPGMGLTVSTTVQVIDPEGTEVASQTFGVSATTDNNVDAVGNFINDAVNSNTETPIDFTSEYGSGVLTLQAAEAGNTNPWTIVINNNGATTENAGNLSTSTVQTGAIINEIDLLSTQRIHGINGEIDITSITNASTTTIDPPVNISETRNTLTRSGTITVTGAPTSVTLELFQQSDSSNNPWTLDLTIDGVSNSTSGTSSGQDIDESVTTFLTIGTHSYTVTSTSVVSTLTTLILREGDQEGRASSIRLEQSIATIAADSTYISSPNGLQVERITAPGGDRTSDDYIQLDDLFIRINSDMVSIVGNPTNIFAGDNTIRFDESGVVFNRLGIDADFTITKSTFGVDAVKYDAGTDTLTFNVGTINGLPGITPVTKAQVDTAIGASAAGSGSLFYDQQGNFTSPAGGSSTTVLGTANQVDVATSGSTATVSLNTTITDAITANTAKTGISSVQALAITANTAKTGITTTQSDAITANTSKVGITTAQATAITNNTAKTGITTAQASAITANTAKVGISTAQASAITANTAKTGISTAQASAITANTAKNSYPTADATKLGTIETNADVTDTANVVGSLTAGTNITITAGGTISAASGGTATTVLGTANEIDVNTVGNTATASLNTAITNAITANTAKIDVNALNQVGATVLSTDSVVYLAGVPLAPRRKTFNLVPLSIMNNDAGFTTNTGTVTSVTGTTNEIDIATGTTTPVVSISSTVTDAIDLNTAKQSVAGLTQVGGAIIASDSVLYYDGTVPRRKVFSSVPLSIFNNDSGFITGITKADVDTAIGDGTNDTDYYASDKTWKSIPSGGSVTKAAVDTAIGASTSGSATMFYNEQGDFVVPSGTGGVSDYDELTDAPITRLRTVETIVLGGTRANIQEVVPGTNEFSTITMQDNFDSSGGGSTALDTSSDITYNTALQAAGRWQFANSVGFSNGMVIADGTAWSTLNGVYLADVTLSGGVGIGNQVSVGDDIRITIGTGAATFTVDEVTTLSIVSAIRLSAATNVVGTINGISTNGTTISFDASILSGGGTAAQFSYDPDTNNNVYTSSIVDQTWANPGSDITTNLTYVANQIAALETNITWDGVITSSTGLREVGGGSTTFRNASPSVVNEWAIRVSAFVHLTPSTGDSWTTLNDLRLEESISTANNLADNVAIGDIIRLTWGNGSADFPIMNITSVGGVTSTTLGNAQDIVGTIDRDFTDGESFGLTADVVTPQSSITLDLGTETNINSSYIVTGGLDNAETLVNTDGVGDTITGVATTITVTDGGGMEVTSFTSSVSSSSIENVDVVGQQIANAVNANTETPIDYSATYTAATNTLVFTAAEASATSPNPWVITINNNSALPINSGNLNIALQVQDGQVINQLDESIITFSNGSQTIALPTPPATGTVTLQSVDGVLSWI